MYLRYLINAILVNMTRIMPRASLLSIMKSLQILNCARRKTFKSQIDD